mmetsp:Transcript_6129/g.9397  ORF Transcript_6129/g.9397 Transcript_6129/m.9397 type:complete len:321 (+) Transcript_6129:79-1041(+)|eukprot:CAMPEP_0195280810 /NCGR_PEP_ID=MMETSP0707-20130614/357_1 /TAXON_ID=33640 /ORGANISM="Asterionellopsis glacialis, Strain CCMP134" /LENGTH=320 /DNA_ID=CAMNT_0040339615 /DNA_START=52 /DNA_END=1014 /DNA_ORIENTATION=+
MMKSRPKKQQQSANTTINNSTTTTTMTSNTEDAVANLERRLEQLDTIPTAPPAEDLTTTSPTTTGLPVSQASFATGLRDPIELEGTLLPPPPRAAAATALPVRAADYDEQVARGYATAIPVQAYTYNEHTSGAAHQQEQQQLPISSTELEIKQQYILDDTKERNERVVQGVAIEPSFAASATAPLIPASGAGLSDKHGRRIIESVTLAEGRRKGKIASEIENEGIRQENRQAYSKEYFNKAAVKDAAKVALQRDREGLQIKQDKYFRQEVPKEKPDNNELQESYFTNESKGGYETKDYETSDYTFGSDYDVQEYKSVYDK